MKMCALCGTSRPGLNQGRRAAEEKSGEREKKGDFVVMQMDMVL